MIERIDVDERRLVGIVRALRQESDGADLRRDLVSKLEAAVRPALLEAKASILSMPSRSEGTGLRQKVAEQVRTHVKLTGKRPGVAIRAHKTGMPRRFHNAPKRLNQLKGWRKPVFGNRNNWVVQIGKPEWFDRAIDRRKPAAIRAVDEVLDDMSARIARRSKG